MPSLNHPGDDEDTTEDNTATRLHALVSAQQNTTDVEDDLTFYEASTQIQEQYSLYSYEYKMNYKSWGSNLQDDMMTNKEYVLIWEWFRDTLLGVRKEEGIVLKTLVYYCVAHEIFVDHTEAFSFFEDMQLSHEHLVHSFTQLIDVLTNSSISVDQSNTLRKHIKSIQRKKKKKNKSQHTQCHDMHDITETDTCTETCAETVTETVTEEPGINKSCSLPALKGRYTSNASPPPLTSNEGAGGAGGGGRRKKPITGGFKQHLKSLPSITAQPARRNRDTAQHSSDKHSSDKHSSDKHSSDTISAAVTHQLRDHATSHSNSHNNRSNSNSNSSNSRSNSSDSIHPVGHLHTIGRVFRRQLSRLSSRDNIQSDEGGVGGVCVETKSKPKKRDKKEKKMKVKRIKKDLVTPPAVLDSKASHGSAQPDTPAQQNSGGAGVLSAIGRAFTRQLSRLASFSEAKPSSSRDTPAV